MDVTSFFTYFTTAISIIGGAIVLAAKIYATFIVKVSRTIGKGKLLDILKFINDLTDEMNIEDARELIIEFHKKRKVELDTKQLAFDVSKLLDIKNIIKKPSVSKLINDYEKKKQVSSIKSIKRWEQFRKSIESDKAIEAILTIINEKRKIQIGTTKQKVKPELDKIKKIFDDAKKSIPMNRLKRIQMDRLKRDLEKKQDNENLDKIKERLCKIFNTNE